NDSSPIGGMVSAVAADGSCKTRATEVRPFLASRVLPPLVVRRGPSPRHGVRGCHSKDSPKLVPSLPSAEDRLGQATFRPGRFPMEQTAANPPIMFIHGAWLSSG